MTDSNTPSITGNIDQYWQFQDVNSSTGYPVDTVRIAIENTLSSLDRKRLRDEDWKETGWTSYSSSKENCNEPRKNLKWTRKSDGLRVISTEHSTMVEVSLPRFFGYSNHNLHLVPQVGMQAFISGVEKNLLPATTAERCLSWVFTRVDIALDFPGNIQALVDHYRYVKIAGGRKLPIAYSETQLHWNYLGMKVKLYGKTQEVLRRCPKDSTVPSNSCRFEITLQNAEMTSFLAEELSEGSDAPIRVNDKVSFSGMKWVSFDRLDLLKFAMDVMSLLTPRVGGVTQFKSLRELAIMAIALYPDCRQAALISLKGTTLRRALKEASALGLQMSGLDMLEMAKGVATDEWQRDRGNLFERCRGKWEKRQQIRAAAMRAKRK